jgi:hypothetical protein
MSLYRNISLFFLSCCAVGLLLIPESGSKADDRVMVPNQSVDTLVAPELEMMDNITENAKMLRMDVSDLKVRFDKILLISDSDELRKQLEGVQRTLIMLERRTHSHWKSCEDLYTTLRAEESGTSEDEKQN